MTTASEKLKQMGEVIAEKKSQASAIGAVFKFALEGAGGGDFIVNLKDNPGVTAGDGSDTVLVPIGLVAVTANV